MKLTKEQLRQIIKEELANAVKEVAAESKTLDEVGGGDYRDAPSAEKQANLYKFKRGEMADNTMPKRASEIKKLIDQKQTSSQEFKQLTTAIREQVVSMLSLYPPQSKGDILARVERYISPHLTDEKPYYVKVRNWIMSGEWPS